ncbi:MAG: hypothetical protein GY834_08500 [Bacteroidetes bacterium]|nr:hypothetical protein [Bacteroidota bacterium]
MYRQTKNNCRELQSIVDIYNEISNRDRTVELHRWEWFLSPYMNKSYVIVGDKGNVIGHHGLLTITLNYGSKIYQAGKTENIIMKKGRGALYFRNEIEMNKEYGSEYDVLITTAARGVIRK